MRAAAEASARTQAGSPPCWPGRSQPNQTRSGRSWPAVPASPRREPAAYQLDRNWSITNAGWNGRKGWQNTSKWTVTAWPARPPATPQPEMAGDPYFKSYRKFNSRWSQELIQLRNPSGSPKDVFTTSAWPNPSCSTVSCRIGRTGHAERGIPGKTCSAGGGREIELPCLELRNFQMA